MGEDGFLVRPFTLYHAASFSLDYSEP